MTSSTPLAPLLPGVRLLRILWRMLPPLFFGGILILAVHLLTSRENLREQSIIVALFVAGFAFVMAIVREVLSPFRPGMRMIRMKDHRAERLTAILRALLYVLLGTELAIYLVEANNWNPAAARMLGLLRNVGLIIFGWSALNRSGLIRGLRPEKVETTGDLLRALGTRFVLPLVFLTVLFFAVSWAFGYVALSRWVLINSGWSVLVIVGVALGYRWLRGRLTRTVAFLQAEEADLEVEEAEDERRPAKEPSPAWIGVERIAAGALKIGCIVGAFFILLAVWELDLDGLRRTLSVPIIAGWGMTWGAVASAIVSVALVLAVAGLVKNLLIFMYFPRAGVDAGARYAILAILRYVTWIIAGLMILDVLGVDTATFAVFAGAFGVGLAFGLQDIFANFFSGLIMLIERPVRVGDLIEVGGSSGRVEAIKLRGTTIRTFDNTTITIPNRQLIGERLTNLTYDMNYARMQIDVGVTYSADPRAVQRLLMGVAQADSRVLNWPGPNTRFTNFGDSSIDFSLRCYTSEIVNRWAIASDIRTKIFEALRVEGIEIPFPQRDLHIRSSIVPMPAGLSSEGGAHDQTPYEAVEEPDQDSAE